MGKLLRIPEDCALHEFMGRELYGTDTPRSFYMRPETVRWFTTSPEWKTLAAWAQAEWEPVIQAYCRDVLIDGAAYWECRVVFKAVRP